MTESGPCAVCLVTDGNYLLPTVVAAIQARTAITVEGAAVIVLAMGLDESKAALYGEICTKAGVDLVQVNRDIVGGSTNASFVDAFFSGSKFTFGALGRFFLDQMIDPKYRQLLYIDGDIQIHGSLDPLLLAVPPQGGFLAAPDPKTFTIYDDSGAPTAARQYMSGLGFERDEMPNYFNSGVLRIDRSGWSDIGMAAWTFLRNHSALCICHDQSALNAVARTMRAPMSLKWNFAPYYRYYGLEALITPSLVHFMAHPKPWNGSFPPWTHREHQPYLDLVSACPRLKPDLRLFKGREYLKYVLLQNYKRLDETLRYSRKRQVLEAVEAYERKAVC